MEKLSCDYLHHSIYLAPNELRHCCKRFFYDGKIQGDVKIFEVNKSDDISIDKIIGSAKLWSTLYHHLQFSVKFLNLFG